LLFETFVTTIACET